MFSNLQDRLERSFQVLKGHGKITELNIAETVKEICRALLEADVNYNVARDFTNRVKEEAIGQRTYQHQAWRDDGKDCTHRAHQTDGR